MPGSRSKRLLIAGAAVCGVGAVLADVTIESKLSVDGDAMMEIERVTGTSVTRIAGERSRTETVLYTPGDKFAVFAQSAAKRRIQILRLDQDRLYDIDVGAQRFAQTPISALRDRMRSMLRQSKRRRQQSPGTFDDARCQWAKPHTVVTQGGSADLLGFSAQQVTVSSTQRCANRSSQRQCDVSLVLERWLAPDAPFAQEYQTFQRAYAAKLGFTATSATDFLRSAQEMFGRYSGVWSEIKDRSRGMAGFELKSQLVLSISGANCRVEEPSSENWSSELARMSKEVTSVSRAAIEASEFEVPEGYAKLAD